MNADEITAFVLECGEQDIDIQDSLYELKNYGTIDGMEPNEWLNALTMD